MYTCCSVLRIRFQLFELRLLWPYSDFKTLTIQTVQLLKVNN